LPSNFISYINIYSMPIKVNLDLILVKRKVSLTDLSKNIGITISNLSVLKLNKVKAIRFSTLEAICRELECTPGDLLEYVDEKN